VRSASEKQDNVVDYCLVWRGERQPTYSVDDKCPHEIRSDGKSYFFDEHDLSVEALLSDGTLPRDHQTPRARLGGRAYGCVELGHALSPASRFRNAASPASEISTHFESGVASAA